MARKMDKGHQQTDKMLMSLEKKLSREYSKAARASHKKLSDYLAKFEAEDKKKLEDLKNNLITHKEYMDWRARAILNTKHFREMTDVLAMDFSNANQIAAGIINSHTIDVYALNHNYGAFEVVQGAGVNLSFELYDHKTVERLMRRNPEIIPLARVDIPKDMRWNRVKLTSAITQGVLTGDSIPHIADRLQKVADMNRSAAIRNARTYTTAAENGGRIDSYKEAEDMGIEMEQEWMATIDKRTRASHIDLDGETVAVGEEFSNGLRYPADPKGDPEEVYNCRCTLRAVVKNHPYDRSGRFARMDYDEWVSMAKPSKKKAKAQKGTK